MLGYRLIDNLRMHQTYKPYTSLIFLFIFLAIGPNLIAQPPNTRQAPQATYRVSVLEQQRRAMESDLQERLAAYDGLPEPAKPQARIDIESLLFAMFDLNMSHLESQSKSLRAQLARMESDPDFNSRTEEIQQLQQSLRRVESNLEYRRNYRVQIVQQRLGELLD